MGCMVPQSFAAGGNRSYSEFCTITGVPRYPGYFYPDKILLLHTPPTEWGGREKKSNGHGSSKVHDEDKEATQHGLGGRLSAMVCMC
jgi:hypothetical protein